VTRSLLAQIIEPRMEEIFALCRRELELSPYRSALSGGCVITGGAVLLEGACKLAEATVGMPVKLGYPRGVGGLTDLIASPVFATAVGLVRHGSVERPIQLERGTLWRRMRHRLEEILKDYM
jgi:cell division protein FtsA